MPNLMASVCVQVRMHPRPTFRSQPSTSILLMISSAIVLLSGVATSGQHPVTENPADRAVAVEMRGVTYHFTADVAVSIPRLNGALVPSKTDEIPVFDDKTSFTLRIDAAEISMPVGSLANVLNGNALKAKAAP